MSPESITICQAPDGSGRLWELGAGGFGVVYKALLDNSTVVAVKFVTNQSFKEQERFKREVSLSPAARVQSSLQMQSCAPCTSCLAASRELRSKAGLAKWQKLMRARVPAGQHPEEPAPHQHRAVPGGHSQQRQDHAGH